MYQYSNGETDDAKRPADVRDSMSEERVMFTINDELLLRRRPGTARHLARVQLNPEWAHPSNSVIIA